MLHILCRSAAHICAIHCAVLLCMLWHFTIRVQRVSVVRTQMIRQHIRIFTHFHNTDLHMNNEYSLLLFIEESLMMNVEVSKSMYLTLLSKPISDIQQSYSKYLTIPLNVQLFNKISLNLQRFLSLLKGTNASTPFSLFDLVVNFVWNSVNESLF